MGANLVQEVNFVSHQLKNFSGIRTTPSVAFEINELP